jgi:hypothetical protein
MNKRYVLLRGVESQIDAVAQRASEIIGPTRNLPGMKGIYQALYVAAIIGWISA